MKSKLTLIAAMLSLAATALSASASELPSGPFSSWSRAEQQQAANALKDICADECASYTGRAQDGGMRAAYEAAACTVACFVNNLPEDYPQLDALKESARQNYTQAQELGSSIPVFLKR